MHRKKQSFILVVKLKNEDNAGYSHEKLRYLSTPRKVFWKIGRRVAKLGKNN
jgi:hypothetical protein